ncbi:MAG: glycosyltransferase [Caldilineaceae bacterium]
MKKVLIVAYMFPPIGGIGVVRPVQFAKYLPDFGWEPVILTVAQTDEYMVDASLLQELPATLQIHRAHSWEPLNAARIKRAASRIEATPTAPSHPAKRNGASAPASLEGQPTLRRRMQRLLKTLYFALRIPDDKLGWYPFAVRLGKQILCEQPIDLIFATAPPYTNLLVGKALKQASGKPLVLDYRDEWTTMRYRDFPTTPVTQAINRRLERNTITSADAVVTAIAPFADNLRTAGLLTETTPLVNLMNGFDPAHYRRSTAPTPNPRFTIVYTGTFYGERQTPAYFLQGLHDLLARRPALRTRIDVRFIGTIFERHAQRIEELGLADVVHCCGVVPHGQAVAAQMNADLLLLVVGKGAGSGVVLTGKVFEYLGAGRPILALAPLDGPAAALIRESQTGTVVDAEDVPTISRTLEQLYDQWAEGKLVYAPNEAVVAQYNRRTQTGELAALFDQLWKKSEQSDC